MPNPCRLALRYRVGGFFLSRLEYVHRELRDFYRTPFGWGIIWFNVGVWTLALLVRFVPV